QFAVRDCRFDGNGVKRSGEVKIGGVLRESGYFAWPIDARRVAADRRSSRRLLCCCHRCSLTNQLAVAIRRACARQRLANSILNPFSLWAFAPRNAASAASRKFASFAGLP